VRQIDRVGCCKKNQHASIQECFINIDSNG